MIKQHIIFSIDLADPTSTNFAIKIHNLDQLNDELLKLGQPELKDEFLDIQIKDMSKYFRVSLGSLWISTITDEHAGYTTMKDDNLHINTGIPLVKLDTKQFHFKKDEPGYADAEILALLFNYIQDTVEEKPEELIRELGKNFNDAGLAFNVEEYLTPPEIVPADVKIDEKSNFKEWVKKAYPCPKEKKIGFHIKADLWYLLVRNVLKGINTMLIGPTGSGKTEILHHLAEAMKRPLNIQDMGTVQDPQSALLGVHRLNKDGHSEFELAPFVSHIQEEEGIVLLDELSRSPLSANNILFPLLDKRRYLPLDIACGDTAKRVNVGKNTMFFATANIGNEFSGTNAIDRALWDRWMIVEMDYPTARVEKSILSNKTGISKEEADTIVKVSSEIRKQHANQELGNSISVRHTLQTAEMLRDGFDMNTALSRVVLPLFEDSFTGSERSKVKGIIAAY